MRPLLVRPLLHCALYWCGLDYSATVIFGVAFIKRPICSRSVICRTLGFETLPTLASLDWQFEIFKKIYQESSATCYLYLDFIIFIFFLSLPCRAEEGEANGRIFFYLTFMAFLSVFQSSLHALYGGSICIFLSFSRIWHEKLRGVFGSSGGSAR